VRILISAAETSSDNHGAELLKAIRREIPSDIKLEAFGIGGPKLQAAGLEAIVDARELLAMGFIEAVGHLPKLYSSLKKMKKAVRKSKPDLAIVIDYPEFHFRLAKFLRGIDVPVVYYIPPKVWVWRKGRIKKLQAYFKKILCILPFESDFYKESGVFVTYVGNPLVDELPLSLTRHQAREALGLKDSDRCIVMMPGSRKSEIKQHLMLMLETAATAASFLTRTSSLNPIVERSPFQVLVPVPTTLSIEAIQTAIQKTIDVWKITKPALVSAINVRVFHGKSNECLVAADVGLIKSGTSTLEAGLLKCPHVVVYKPSRTTAWIFKNLIRYQGPVGLVNLVAAWDKSDSERQSPEENPGQNNDLLVREILCEQVTLESLSDEVVALFRDENKRKKMKDGFNRLREKMEIGGVSPSLTAAREILSWKQ